MSGNPASLLNLNRGRHQLKIGMVPVVVSCTEIDALRNTDMAFNRYRSQIINPGIFPSQTKSPTVSRQGNLIRTPGFTRTPARLLPQTGVALLPLAPTSAANSSVRLVIPQSTIRAASSKVHRVYSHSACSDRVA